MRTHACMIHSTRMYDIDTAAMVRARVASLALIVDRMCDGGRASLVACVLDYIVAAILRRLV